MLTWKSMVWGWTSLDVHCAIKYGDYNGHFIVEKSAEVCIAWYVCGGCKEDYNIAVEGHLFY